MNKFRYVLLLIVALSANVVCAELVKYQFDIDTKILNFTGTEVKAIAINDQIPGPTIEAKVGDVLEVTFNNKMNVETSIHWHGVLLPNDQDGVPYLTTQPIAPHSSFTYRYKITHHGTYWCHSHTGLQEQVGAYASLVFHPKGGEKVRSDRDYVLVLSDWTNEKPKQVLANLKKDGDYYALKKKSVQSWDKVIAHGKRAIKNRLQSAWSRMGPMDLSDVGYDAFLSNGQQESYLKAKKGDMVRIRLINAAASSYFNVEFASAPMTIVAADGVDVEPFQVKRLRIAIAETYDVLVPIQENKSYELRASSEDGTGKTSTFIGEGERVLAPDIPRPNVFLMDHSMHDKHASMHGSSEKSAMQDSSNSKSPHSSGKMKHGKGMKKMKHNKESVIIEHMTDYEHLRAIHKTSFDPKKVRRNILLNLTGNMRSYVWSFNNRTLFESERIMIKKGDIVRFTLQNKTMMHHPIHLHGHFFRVINKQGDRSPLKHTLSIAPMSRAIIEFDANEEKDWFFHCHNIYHMKTGMAAVVSYEGSRGVSLSSLSHDDYYFRTDMSAFSNMTTGVMRASKMRSYFEMEYDYNYKKKYDAEIIYARSMTPFLDVYLGGNFENKGDAEQAQNTAIVGMRYVLPMLIESNVRIDSKGRVRLSLSSDLQLTARNKLCWSYNTDREYRFNFLHEVKKKFGIAANYDSDFKWGIGLRIDPATFFSS